MPRTCERCGRPTPLLGTPEWGEWEISISPEGFYGVLCPGCMTADERRIIELSDQHYRDLADGEDAHADP